MSQVQTAGGREIAKLALLRWRQPHAISRRCFTIISFFPAGQVVITLYSYMLIQR